MISIIIPTFNEAAQIADTINKINHAKGVYSIEIIIVDGGSSDDTLALAKAAGAIAVKSPKKGRAAQMNYGASIAKRNILYFLHADSFPPKEFITKIEEAINNGKVAGCFRLTFDYDHWFLRANAWFTRFDINSVRFGDQSLFVQKEIFEKCGGFLEDLVVMEDQEIIHRLKKLGSFKVLNDVVTTSARKYLAHGIYKMQAIFLLIWSLYYLGYSQDRLVKVYKKLIREHKL